MEDAPALELAEVAASSGSLNKRARWMLDRLHRVTPFDAAWLASVDPLNGSYSTLAATGLDRGTQAYLSGPQTADDIERTHANRARPPRSPSDLPYPAQDLPTWAECLIPAGFHEALAVALFTIDHRYVGFLALLSESARPPTTALRRRLHELTPILARGIDPLRSLTMSAQMLTGASAGAALFRDGTQRPLPGLGDDGLLVDGSPVTALARAFLADGQVFTSFLWRRGNRDAPEEHLRVTVLASPADAPVGVLGAIVLAPAADLRGLTPRELEVLGLVIEGLSNQQIAVSLVVTPRTVATHLEHILAKLDAPTRTLAAVRAERQGLYVPSAATGEDNAGGWANSRARKALR
jgi:DNA-binding CsgD family transcriptional regulator